MTAPNTASKQPGISSSQQQGEPYMNDRGSSHGSADTARSLIPDSGASPKQAVLRVSPALASLRAKLSRQQPTNPFTLTLNFACMSVWEHDRYAKHGSRLGHDRMSASISKHSEVLLSKVGKFCFVGRANMERQRTSLLEKEGRCYSLLRTVPRAQATDKVTATIAGERPAPESAGCFVTVNIPSDLICSWLQSKPGPCIKCPDTTSASKTLQYTREMKACVG